MGLTNEEAMRCTTFIIGLLWLKMTVNGFAQVAARRKAGTLRTPEDARYGGNAGEGAGLTGSSGSTASEAEQRWQRIMLNDLENIPMACIILILANTSFVNAGVQVALGIIFLGARLAHTFCYACGLQPWRTICFTVGVLCMLILAVASISEAFKTQTTIQGY